MDIMITIYCSGKLMQFLWIHVLCTLVHFVHDSSQTSCILHSSQDFIRFALKLDFMHFVLKLDFVCFALESDFVHFTHKSDK